MQSSSLRKEDLEKLYLAGYSMADIAKNLQCSMHKVVYWMQIYNITRRARSDALYLKYNPNGDPFHIKEDLNAEDKFLMGLGLGIYWGEGEKASIHAIRVANTDSGVIKTFIRFLLDICQVENRKISYSIVCFNDSDPAKSKEYWANELGISGEKFGKIVQIPTQGKGIYKRKSQFGVCTVTVSNIKLKSWLMNEIFKLNQADIA